MSYVPYGYYEDRYRSSSQAAQLCDAQSKVAHLKAQVAVRDAIIDELSEQCDRLYVHERDWKLAVAAGTIFIHGYIIKTQCAHDFSSVSYMRLLMQQLRQQKRQHMRSTVRDKS